MATISAAQEQEVTYLSGVTAQKTVAAQSFWTWNGDNPANYSSVSSEAKWGSASAGTAASVTVLFDAASNWSGTEQAAIQTALHLWSDVANIHFDVVSSSAADIVIARGSDGSADDASHYTPAAGEGSTSLGTLTSSRISIDTSVAGFGPVGAGFQVDGGYPWLTLVHEIGHAIGLGHSGAYDEGTSTGTPMLTPYDSTAWSIMSYNPGSSSDAAVGGAHDWGYAADGTALRPVTPMALDILAAQRIYGAATSTPLSGGQVFGFHSNVQGDTAAVYDFTVNTRPVVTIWDAGDGNALDLSGYAMRNGVDLHAGSFSSVGGGYGNLAIAFDTKIDSFVGGTGTDQVTGNDDGDMLMGNAGVDYLVGGAGNDHIWGNMASAVQGSQDGNDTIYTGLGTNYVNGNAGDDTIYADGDVGRIYGGAGNDTITVRTSGTSHVNGNAGNDTIVLSSGTNFAYGGRDDDHISATGGNNVMSGDAGNDVLSSGLGVDVMIGGAGRDTFQFSPNVNQDPYAGAALIPLTRTHGVAPADRSGALAGYHDEITDFTHGEDVISIGNDAGGARAVLHGDSSVVDYETAANYARSIIATAGTPSAIAAVQVGDDTFLFYNEAGTGSGVDSAIKLDHVSAAFMQSSDFGLI
jgi:serralysin